MRVVTIQSTGTAFGSWTVDRDSVLTGVVAFDICVLSFEPELTFASFTNPANLVSDAFRLLFTQQYPLRSEYFGLDVECKMGKIICVAWTGVTTSLVSLFLTDLPLFSAEM